MSSMEKIKHIDEVRLNESREMIREAMSMSLGSYTEQEAKKMDTWRDTGVWDLINHAGHEIEELRRSNNPTLLIHNGMDLVNLGAMLVAKGIMAGEMAGK